ncbi:restriction endonuclease subunit S [Porphyromonas gingivalis]|uniref:restriction endonuclease subunit S n=1 Tax=Porphyromonas gingivalis TaxID=837 RepID=UPI0030B06AE5
MAKNHKIAKCPPLRFPEFADEWKQTTLGEILAFETGYPFPSDSFNGEGNGVRLIKNRDLKTDDRIIYYEGEYDERYIVQNGDILIGMDGDFSPCLWKKGKALLNQRVGRINTNQNASRVFILYVLADSLKEIELKTSSTTVKHLSHKDVEKIKASLPSLAEQQKIAGFLSLIDERIESCSETIKERKAQKSCLRTLILNRMTVRWIKLKQAVEQGIINLKRGEVIPKQSQSSENIYPVYSSSVQNKGLMGFHNSYMFDKELISWSIDGGGHLFYRPRHKFNVTNVCGVLETSCFDYVFLCEVLKEQHRKLLFDYQNKAHPSVIQELYQVPMLEISEQRYYGKLFRLLDERIEVEEELLEQYERQKRYLLKQMFI